MIGRSRIEHHTVSPSMARMPEVEVAVPQVPGVFAWGPMGVATLVISEDDFKSKFGGYLASYLSPAAVIEFFRAGGKRAVISRVCHWDGNGDPDSAAKASATLTTGALAATYGTLTGTVAAPFALADGDTLLVDVDRAGAPTTATFAALPAELTNTVNGPYALSDGITIQFSINGGAAQVVTFSASEFVDITQATATEVAAVMAAQLKGVLVSVPGGTRIKLTTDKAGTDASIDVLEVGGGYGADANAALRFDVAAVYGSGDCADADSVTLSEVKTWLEGAVGGITVGSSGGYLTIRTNTLGAAGAVQVAAASSADTKLGLSNAIQDGTAGGTLSTLTVAGKYYGALGNQISVVVAAATSGEAARFNLSVYLNSKPVRGESYSNLTMDASDPNYAIDVVNTKAGKSKYIELTDLGLSGTAANRRPANTAGTSLTGGDDGLTGLVTADFIGTSANLRGIYAFQLTTEGDRMSCPDDTTSTFQIAATNYCDNGKSGKVIFLPDAPQSSDYDAVATHEELLPASEARTGLFWPWVEVPNPDTTVFGADDTLLLPPSLLVCGRMAKNNSTENNREQMWRQPSNAFWGLLDNAVGIEDETVLDPNVRDFLSRYRVNYLMAGIRPVARNYGVWVDDTRAGMTTGNFWSIGEICGVAYLRRIFEEYLEIHRNQGNDEDMRRAVQDAFEGELQKWTARGAFESKDASKAFYVDADPDGTDLNNAEERDNEAFNVLVAVATKRAARLMRILFTRDDRGVRSQILKDRAVS